MFTLAKLAYIVCNKEERWTYDYLGTITIDVRPCCIDVLNYMKNETGPNMTGDNVYVHAKRLISPPSQSMMEKAAFSGHVECMKFAADRGFPLTRTVCEQAAFNGQLECLKYARQLNCPWDELVCEYAASRGHVECLRYAHEDGCAWDEIICEKAAKNGHLECLVYARTNDCPWDQRTCEAAAASGHFDILKYARENGCPWDENACREAATCSGGVTGDKWFSEGHGRCLEYVIENAGRPQD